MDSVSEALSTTTWVGRRNNEKTGTAQRAKPKPVNARITDANKTTAQMDSKCTKPKSANNPTYLNVIFPTRRGKPLQRAELFQGVYQIGDV
jgi:hypothetical protein